MKSDLCGPPERIAAPALLKRADQCAVLIVAAGFEERARRILDIVSSAAVRRIVLVRYPGGIKENDDMYATMHALSLGDASCSRVVETVVLDLRRADEYSTVLSSKLLQWRPEATGEVWVDISALAMQGICATLAAVRASLPGLAVEVLYTEAGEYHPTKAEVAAATRDDDVSALSKEMDGNAIPKQFAGSSSAVSSCLVVFAGYEKHRSFGVVEELNPTRLVLVYGEPPGNELRWRLQWSKRLHSPLHIGRQSASEKVSTLDPLQSLAILNLYYGFLFSDHNVAVSPICSKMQCVGCYLFWERYRDVQLVFPLPVRYLPTHFSKRWRNTFRFRLPTAGELAMLTPSTL